MDFLQKLDYMMEKYSLNKSTLSQKSGIPYTTIDGWYKKGYEGMKLSTLRILSDYFNTVLDYWGTDEITDPNAWKASGFVVDADEMGHIQKYRLLTPEWQEVVNSVLNIGFRKYQDEQAATVRAQTEAETDNVCFILPYYMHPSSAGAGDYSDGDEWEDLTLSKRPPRGTSFVVRVHGDSMGPTFRDGDRVFVRSQIEVAPGQIGIFHMDGQQWIKELGDGELISHNPSYPPRPMADDIRCQGLVLGVCDEGYFA